MGTLPQLIEEDVQQINATLCDFLAKTEATAALVTAEGGFLIVHQGDTSHFDPTTLGALASNAFLATQAIAQLIQEPNFTCIYQQGEKYSLFVRDIDKFNLLIVIFPSSVSVGVVKYYAASVSAAIAAQIETAHKRAPDQSLDLAMLNLADSTPIFTRKPGV